MGKWADFAIGAGQSILGAGLGIMLGREQDKRQLQQQRHLTDMQFDAQRRMLDYSKQKELEMWKATNYPAQVAQLKQAGLNPGLLYGMSGGGGTTVGGGSPSISGGTAAGHSGEPQALAGMGMQLGMMAAQQELLKSQARLNNVEADKKAGVDTQEAKTRIANILQGVENQKAQQELTQVQTNIARLDERLKDETIDNMEELTDWQVQKAAQETNNLWLQGLITKATANDVIDKLHAEAIGAYIENALKKQSISQSEEQVKKWAQEIAQQWLQLKLKAQEVSNQSRGLDQKDTEILIDKFKAEFEAQNPGVLKQASGWINDLIDGMRRLMGKETRPGRKIQK